jgi:hypothetical protein
MEIRLESVGTEMSGWATLWPSIAIVIVALIWNDTVITRQHRQFKVIDYWEEEIKRTFGAFREFLKRGNKS